VPETPPVKVRPFEHGPYVQAALFCDQVIIGNDNVLSLIRIIDTLTHSEHGPTAPAQMPEVPYRSKLVIMLKSGMARGPHEVKIEPVLPSGEVKPPVLFTVHFEGEERGANLIVDFPYTYRLEGLYWFNVYVDDELITRIPFRVKYVRTVTG